MNRPSATVRPRTAAGSLKHRPAAAVPVCRELLTACAGHEIFFEHSDGRIVLIDPMEDRVLVGTTDIGAVIKEPAVCTEEEVEYFFDLIRHVFPSVPVSRDHIVYRFSAIRPLPAHDKWTTFRVFTSSSDLGSREIASVLAPSPGWSCEQQRDEIRYAERVMADSHGVRIRSLIG